MIGIRSPLAVAALLVFAVPAIGGVGSPDFYGYLGYGYRSVNSNESAMRSHQLSGTINTETYIWQPWFATADLSLAYMGDKSEDSSNINNAGSLAATHRRTTSRIYTGNIGVNVLSRSKVPFSLRLQATDSRMGYSEEGPAPIVFVGKDYSTSHIGLSQGFLTGLGRVQLNFDHRTSGERGGGEYSNRLIGLNADLRWAKQRLVIRASHDKGSYDLVERTNKNTIFDVSNFYAASRYFRLDSKVSFYRYDRSFLDMASIERRFARREIAQLSSNAFYRPASLPLSFSAGARISRTDGRSQGVLADDQAQVSLHSGVFYRLNQNMRMDLSASSTFKWVDGVYRGDHRQYASWRYDSPMTGRLAQHLTYKWYMAANINNYRNAEGRYRSQSISIGQNLAKVIYFGERTGMTNLRFFGNQAFKYTGGVDVIGRLDHSLSSAFNQKIWGGQTLLQLTLSDSRDSQDSTDVRQLVNFQFNRSQEVAGNGSLTGNFTAQYVLHEYEEVANYSAVDEFTGQMVNVGDIVRRERDVVTMSGGVKYGHTRLFSIPRLAFNLGYRVAKTSTEGAIDRSDANAGMLYSIGMLDLSATYSLTDADGRNYDLLYFRAMRRY